MKSKNWIDFLENIKNAKQELGNPKIIWFRGQSNSDFYLLPSLLRYTNGIEKEPFLFRSFSKFSDKLNISRKSDWETLFDMQHYGLPTRLLDWTESFGIALYFAAFYNNKFERKKNAAIYLMNPFKLNSHSHKSYILNLPENENSFAYKEIYWKRKPVPASAPIAIEPVFKNDRIFAQRGAFTVHNDSINPIEEKFPDAIKKVILNNNTISDAIDFLDLANINEFSVFPDLAGISNYLKMSAKLIPRK